MNIVSLRLVHPTDLLISLDVRPREQSVSEAARRLHPSAPASSTNSLRSNPPCRGLGGRLDRSRIVALGHSLGGHTVGRLAGMRVTDPADGEEENLIDPRIQAAVRLGAPGSGANLAAFASKHLPGRGHPLRGPAMRDALHLLTRDFDRTAVPAHGRYVGEPARADESGTTYVPPEK